MSEFMYINPGMINPVTKANVRDGEIAKLKDLKEKGYTIIGLEMTVPALAEICDKNIDPQHTEGKADECCAKTIAKNAEDLLSDYRGKDVMFVTNRVDVDSVAAYVLADRFLQGEKVDYTPTIAAINAHDAFQGAKWSGPKPIEQAFDPESKTGALAASIQVFKVTPENIADVRGFIDSGEVRDAVMAKFRGDQQAIIDKVKSGEIKTEVVGGVAYVESTDRAATNVGYSMAPVVVAVNPTMPAKGGYTYRKLSICQHEGGYFDISSVSIALNKIEIDKKIKEGTLEQGCVEAQIIKCKEAEPHLSDVKALEKACSKLGGWGGSPTFLGSPAEQNCTTSMSDIKKLVFANLTPDYKAKVTSQSAKANDGQDK